MKYQRGRRRREEEEETREENIKQPHRGWTGGASRREEVGSGFEIWTAVNDAVWHPRACTHTHTHTL